MKTHGLVVIVSLGGALLLAPAAIAGRNSSNEQHSARVLHGPQNGDGLVVEVDYENRSAVPLQSQFDRRPGHHNDQLAIASFGNTAVPFTSVNALIVYFNFDNAATPLASDPLGAESSTISTSGPVQFDAAFGTSANEPPGYTNPTPNNDLLAFTLTNATTASFQFTYSGTGYQNMVLSFAANDGSPSGVQTQTLSFSTNGTDFTTLGSIPYNTLTGYIPHSFTLPGSADGASSITIRDDFVLTSGNFPATNIDNIQVNGDVTSVPEPATCVGAGLAVAVIGWMQRRRLLALAGIA